MGGDSPLVAEGRWTTEDCDSRFRAGSDAHTYRFSLAEGSRIRIELASTDGDSFLYLMTEDGSRITQNDDGGSGLDARIERDLAPGAYLVEATTVGGRARGAADFTFSVGHVAGCDVADLGVLGAGSDLTATGRWTLDTCGSRFVAAHPAYGYSFALPQPGLVRIDLISENGDPVLSLVSPTLGVIGANDDGGGGRNARIEQYLPSGTYLIEATTYLERDLQPLEADFELVVSLVDEQARQAQFQLKIEDVHIPDVVIAGQPFELNYRVGNLGGGDLADAGGRATVYAVAPGLFERTGFVSGSGERWLAGAAYHSGPVTASATSVAISELHPLIVTLNRPGPGWVFTAVYARDAAGEEIGWHGLWRNLMVISGLTFDVAIILVDGEEYVVAAAADDEGVVVPWVGTADRRVDVDDAAYARVVYAGATQHLTLDGILDRPAIVVLRDELEAREDPAHQPVRVPSPSSTTLLELFGRQYVGAFRDSGLPESVAAGNVVTRAAVEDFVLASADGMLAHIAPMVASWTEVAERVDGGGLLTFEDALAIQSELALAETSGYPLAVAARATGASRASEDRWADAAVLEMIDELAALARCDGSPSLADALAAAGAEDATAMLALDTLARDALPAYGLATDAALCAIGAIDASNSTFLRLLTIAGSDVDAMIAPSAPAQPPVPEPEPQPLSAHVVARLAEDGRIEHGVEVIGGEVILPKRRFFDAEPHDRRWHFSSDVEVAGGSIGIIRARRLDDGRIEVGFDDVDGNTIVPALRYLPTELAADDWVSSSVFEVPPPAPPEEPVD